MTTKAEFQQKIADAISSYPTAAQFYQAQDPRLLAQLNAMATMLAMFSDQQDVAAAEPFTKARDVTVLADAAVKGVLPFGSPTRARLAVTNGGSQAVTIAAGRRLLDTQGRLYVVAVGSSVPAAGSANIEVLQRREEVLAHTVTVSQPFYTIDVPQPAVGSLAEVRVKDSSSTVFTYTPNFTNVPVGATTFHLETDESRQLYVQFGAEGIAGYQPAAGEVFTVTLVITEGYLELAAGLPFAFEYSASIAETLLTLTLDAVLAPGANPMDIATLREVCSYPSIYDDNAVYLSNFDFLVRKQLSPFDFLSIWNEQREEEVRGASVDNINHLFVAARKAGVAPATLQAQIEQVIWSADDSYRITHVEVDDVEIPVVITIYAQSVYDFAAVAEQVRQIILAEYGAASDWAKRGENRILYKAVYESLRNQVQALQGTNSDMRLEVTDPVEAVLPEQFRYVSQASLTVTVEEAS